MAAIPRTEMQRVYIIGAAGFSLEVVEALCDCEVSIAGLFDDDTRLQERNSTGIPYLGVVEEFILNTAPESPYVLAIGDNELRERFDRRFMMESKLAFTVIHPAACVSPRAQISDGAYIAPFAFVGPRCVIGRQALLNVGCSIGHDSVLGDYVQVCPGARLSGHSQIGTGAFIASNAVVPPSGRIGKYAKLAANSFAARPIPDYALAVGVPARVV